MAPRLPSVSEARHDPHARSVVTRAEAAADAIASVRAEGLDPGRAKALLAAWAGGQITDEQLEQARRKLMSDRSLSVEQLLAGARAA